MLKITSHIYRAQRPRLTPRSNRRRTFRWAAGQRILKTTSGSQGKDRVSRLGALFGVLFAVLYIARIFIPDTAETAAESLANYDGRVAILFGVVSTFSGIFAVLFVLSLRAALPRRDSVLTTAAVVFSIIASMVPVVVHLISLDARATLAGIYNNSAVTAVDKAAAPVSEQVLEAEEEAFFALFIGAPLAIGLFSGSMWKSRVFPNWVTYVGLAFITITGIALLLVAIGVVAPVLGFVYYGLFLLWILATSVYLWRSDRKTATSDRSQ